MTIVTFQFTHRKWCSNCDGGGFVNTKLPSANCIYFDQFGDFRLPASWQPKDCLCWMFFLRPHILFDQGWAQRMPEELTLKLVKEQDITAVQRNLIVTGTLLMQELARSNVLKCEAELTRIQEALDALYAQQNQSTELEELNRTNVYKISPENADIEISLSSDDEDERALVNRIACTLDCSDVETPRYNHMCHTSNFVFPLD